MVSPRDFNTEVAVFTICVLLKSFCRLISLSEFLVNSFSSFQDYIDMVSPLDLNTEVSAFTVSILISSYLFCPFFSEAGNNE